MNKYDVSDEVKNDPKFWEMLLEEAKENLERIEEEEIEEECECSDCGKEINKGYFHSKCCHAHFEGVFKGKDRFIACEKCGKILGGLK